jgi:Flp pilus assembly protein TadD
VESNPVAAAELFAEALEVRPGDHEANYGYGYAMVRAGNVAAARSYLCRAQGASDIEIRREVASLLERNALTCD